MKALYISHYREASGWGQVARDYILALDRAGVEVVPRAITLGNPTAEIPPRLAELAQNNVRNCDVCIQHVLPHYMKYDSHFKKNVGIFELESSNIKLTSWPSSLNLMDELWVPCTSMKEECIACGITKPIYVVPHTFDTTVYEKEYPRLDLPTHKHFTFYFIGEMNKRKHLSALIKAFNIEFQKQEPVELVVKVNKFGSTPEQLANDLSAFCNTVKNGLRLYKDISRYKSEIIITANVAREDLLRLHSTCDCFVCPSYGEAWCIPAWEAMAMGKLVIAGDTGAMADYIDAERNGFLVRGNTEPVFGQEEMFGDFGTSRERWFEISTTQLMKTMRRVYEMPPERKKKISLEAKMSAKQYDYSMVGNKMKELLNV